MIMERKKNKPKKKYYYPPKEGEHRFTCRFPVDVWATLGLLSHIEDASLNSTIISLINREMMRKKQA